MNQVEQAKHTPGPWIYQGASETGIGIWAGRRFIGEAWPGSSVDDHDDHISYDEMVRNAELMTAAPELKDAVDDLLDLVIWASSAFDTEEKSAAWVNSQAAARISAAFAVLAKATGVQS